MNAIPFGSEEVNNSLKDLPTPEEIAALDDEQAARLEMLFCGPDVDCNACSAAHREAFEKRRAKKTK